MKRLWTIVICMCVMMLLCLATTSVQAAEFTDGSEECAHEWNDQGWCYLCDTYCFHESWVDGFCATCGSECNHYWESGVCQYCEVSCSHEWVNGCCDLCGTYCYHENWREGYCATCQMPCNHQYDYNLFVDGVCMFCGHSCEHYWSDGFCFVCNSSCAHSWFDGRCTICYLECAHDDVVDGVCSVCGKNENTTPTACLRGDFNNWGYEVNMAPVNEDVLSIMVPVSEEGTHSFSLIYDGKTYSCSQWISPVFQYTLSVGSGNMQVTFPYPGRYIFYLNTQTMSLRVQYAPENMYVCGSFNNWGEGVLMTYNGDGSFSATMILEPGEYEFAFTDNQYFNRKLDIKHTVAHRSYVTAIVNVYPNNGLVGAMSVGNDPIVVVPTLTMDYPTLAFEDEILYNIYYTLDDASDVVEMGLITFNEKLTDGTIDNAVDIIPGYVDNGTGFTVHTKGIPAKNLGDELFFKVYAKLSDGSYVYSDVAGYHAVAYANTVLNSEEAPQAKALMVAMLNYGAAAQEYFGYKPDALMNAALTAEQQALVSAYDSSMVQDVVKADASKVGSFVMNGGYSNIWPTVSFEGAFSINYYFTPDRTVDAAPIMYYWDAATYASVDVLTSENATGVLTMTQAGDHWYAAVDGIVAKAIDETVYVAGCYTGEGISYPSGVIAYSLGNYCKSVATNGQPFGAATAVYGYYAKAYFA